MLPLSELFLHLARQAQNVATIAEYYVQSRKGAHHYAEHCAAAKEAPPAKAVYAPHTQH